MARNESLRHEGNKLLKDNGCEATGRTSCLDCPSARKNRRPKFQMVIGGEFSVYNLPLLHDAAREGHVFLKPHGSPFDIGGLETADFNTILRCNHQRNSQRVIFYASNSKAFIPVIRLIKSLRYPIKFRIGTYGHGPTGVPTFQMVETPSKINWRLSCESVIDEDERKAIVKAREEDAMLKAAMLIIDEMRAFDALLATPFGRTILSLAEEIPGSQNEPACDCSDCKHQRTLPGTPVKGCTCPDCEAARAAKQ